MPCDRECCNSRIRVKPYYSPVIYRARFVPETLLNSPHQILRRVWGLPEVLSPSTLSPSLLSHPEVTPSTLPEQATEEGDNEVEENSITKPHGEVTRITRGGYNLQEELGWEPGLYTAVQVWRSKTYVESHSWHTTNRLIFGTSLPRS